MEDSKLKVIDDLISSIDSDFEIKEFVGGERFNLVRSKNYGLASTLGQRYEGKISVRTAKELSMLCYSKNVSEASVGLAAINSLIDVDEGKLIDINARDIIVGLSEEKNVSVIGYFPFVEELRKVAKNLFVMEMRQKEGTYPEEAKDHLIPVSDVVVISGTTLINHTFYSIISLCRSDAKKILLGPSTPLSEVLFDYGVDVVSGIVVKRGTELRRFVERGLNFREIKKHGLVSLGTLLKDRKLINGVRK